MPKIPGVSDESAVLDALRAAVEKLVAAKGVEEAALARTEFVAVGYVPVYTGDVRFFLGLLKKCITGPAWKRTTAAEIAEYIVTYSYLSNNPISVSIGRICTRIPALFKGGQPFFSKAVRATSYIFALFILACFWPFGVAYRAMKANFRHLQIARCEATFRAADKIDVLPYMFEAAAYTLLAGIFGVLALPLYVLLALAAGFPLLLKSRG